jgi:hypothetical protein
VDDDVQAEIKRLAAPTRAPSFWAYLWEKNYWVYFNVPSGFFLWIFTIVYFQVWWASLIVGILFGAAVGNAIGSWRLWKKRVQWQRENEAWVEKMSTGTRPFPRDLAWTMFNLVEEGKTPVAAKVMLGYLEATDPQFRRLSEEWDALPEEEKKRRQAEAMAQADADIAREKEG